MKCKEMKKALRKQQIYSNRLYRRLKRQEGEIIELQKKVNQFEAVSTAEIRWNRLRVTVRTEVDPMFAYEYPNLRELELRAGVQPDKCLVTRRILLSY